MLRGTWGNQHWKVIFHGKVLVCETLILYSLALLECTHFRDPCQQGCCLFKQRPKTSSGIICLFSGDTFDVDGSRTTLDRVAVCAGQRVRLMARRCAGVSRDGSWRVNTEQSSRGARHAPTVNLLFLPTVRAIIKEQRRDRREKSTVCSKPWEND